MSSASANVQAKAERLLAGGCLQPDMAGQSRIFTVIGDTATYWPVVVTPTRRFCPCAAQTIGCSHLEAAVEYLLAEGDRARGKPSRIAEYEQALAVRRERDCEAIFERLGA